MSQVIYKLKCEKCECCYVGSTSNYKSRLIRHRSHIKCGTKRNVYDHFRKHGGKFSACVIDSALDRSEGQDVEQSHIDKIPLNLRLNTFKAKNDKFTTDERRERAILHRWIRKRKEGENLTFYPCMPHKDLNEDERVAVGKFYEKAKKRRRSEKWEKNKKRQLVITPPHDPFKHF